MTRFAIPFVLSAALLSACTTSAADYPSLLPRPIEKIGLAEPVRPVPVATPDATLDARIAKLAGEATSAKSAFDAAAARTGKTVSAASGAAEGSERWLGAQLALAELDVARTAIDVPLAELERLAVDRAAAGAPPYPALDAALAKANAASTEQRTTIATLTARLK